MSDPDFYSYRQLEPYPQLYPDQYHLRHLENAGWERGFVDSLAEISEEGSRKKVPQKVVAHNGGSQTLTGAEGYNRLDTKHRPGWVVQDLAGVQA